MPKPISRNDVIDNKPPKPYYDRDNITLYHADCKNILSKLASESIDFIWTDPPYGMNQTGGKDLASNIGHALGEKKVGDTLHLRPILNDGKEANELVKWVFAESNRLLPKGACCCFCCPGGAGKSPRYAYWSIWLDEAVGLKQCVVFDKGPIGLGWHYRRSYEFILVGEKPGAPTRWYDMSSRIENIIRPKTLGGSKLVPHATQHPTEKPLWLVQHFLRLHTREGDLVLDPFLGGGTTALACAKMNRRCIGIELDEEHCKMTVERLQNDEGNDFLMEVRRQARAKHKRTRS